MMFTATRGCSSIIDAIMIASRSPVESNSKRLGGRRVESPLQRELVTCYLNRLSLVAQMRLDCRGDLGKGEGAVSAEGVEVCEGVEQ